MARKKRPRGEAHVRIHRYEMECPAWRTLSPAGRALLVEMRALFDVTRGDNRIFMSVREMMARCNLTQRAASRARDDLVERGWIKIVEPGGFSRKVRHATVFALQNEPANSGNGAPASKEYLRWRPPEEKNTVCKSTTDRYANRLPRQEKTLATVCKSTTDKAVFRSSSVVESTTQIPVATPRGF